MIYIRYEDNRPAFIRAGKPIYSVAFQKMTAESSEKQIMAINTSKQVIADEFKKMKVFEDELHLLSQIFSFNERSGIDQYALNDRQQFLINELDISRKKYEKHTNVVADSKAKLSFE